MVEYPSYMVLSILQGRFIGLGTEQLLAQLVLKLADAVSITEDRKKSKTNTMEMEDVRQSRQGDSDAYRRLIERHQKHVSRILWRFSRDPLIHEELVQDVFVEAYMSLRSYHGKAPFEHWLSRIATRVGYRYWKQNERRRKTESFTLEEWDQVPGEPADEIDPSQAADIVHRLLAQMQPRDRLVLTLRYMEGCNVAETARRTGWTKSMVKVQSWRARKRLEQLFAQTGKGLIR